VTADTIEFGRDGIVSDDRELARRAQQGDAEAHAELLRRHRRMVVSVVYAILGCRDEAEDTAQEAFVNAYRSIKGYRLRYPYVAWLRRIAVNAAITQLRRRGRERRDQAVVAAELGTTTPEGRPVVGSCATRRTPVGFRRQPRVTGDVSSHQWPSGTTPPLARALSARPGHTSRKTHCSTS